MSDLQARLLSDYAELQAKQKSTASRQASIARLQRLVATHLPGKRQAALDLGAGQGELVVALQNLGFAHATGVELSPSQVRLAQSHGCHSVQQGVGEKTLAHLADVLQAWAARY